MRERDIFIEALETGNPSERAALLDKACQEDAALRGRVERLLAEHERQESFILDTPPAGVDATVDHPISERPGTVIGPYKLLQQIGEGGMGVVFMAEQTEPIQRTVALKIIKPGMDTRQVIARFEAERQALALMDHPNIAKVLDAGTTSEEASGQRSEDRKENPALARTSDLRPPASSSALALTSDLRPLTSHSGRPYFVMELVKGVPITRYCDDKHLPLRARLELFTQVCQAVQHAHQKGIIHRDIKPTNVLVAEYDDKPVPKVIDFGVAKATAQRLTERTMFTEFGQVLGTLEYMSPEQAKLNQLDIDTRSDIYSLGVLLYELLAGSTPFERKRLHEAAFDEMLRIIREEEPPKPSTRLSTLSLGERASSLPLPPGEGRGEGALGLASIAANRHTEPARLSKEVQGELDWIVMKALEKDRNRRYETASGFAADIERHLHDEPVEAGPPSAAYRFRKFARRNKAALMAGSVVAAALLLGLVGTAWQAIRATHAERMTQVQLDRALEAEKLAKGESERAAQEAVKAKTETAIAQAVNDFLNRDLLAQAEPYVPYDRYNQPRAELMLSTVLHRAAGQLEGRFPGQPLVEASLRQTIGRTYNSLGDSSRALPHLRRAVELQRAHLGDEHPLTLVSMAYLGGAANDLDLVSRVLEVRRRVLGRDHPDTLNSMFLLAIETRDNGETTRAIELFRETLQAQRRVLGEDHYATAWTGHVLAHTLVMSAGKAGVAEADAPEIESLFRHALVVARKFSGDAWNTYDITQRLGEFLNSRRRYEEAETVLKDGLSRLNAMPAAPPDIVASHMNELRSVYKNLGKPELAAELERQQAAVYESALARNARLLRDRHEDPDLLASYASLLFRLQRYGEAEAAYRAAISLDPGNADTLCAFALALRDEGKPAAAEPLHRQALAILRKQSDVDHSKIAHVTHDLAYLLMQIPGNEAEAEQLYRQALHMRRKSLGDGDAATADTALRLAQVLGNQGKFDEAEALLQEAYAALAANRASAPAREYEPVMLRWIVELNRGWKKPEKGAEWERKLPPKELDKKEPQVEKK